jgi:sugar phosphate isomerase/epimerase
MMPATAQTARLRYGYGLNGFAGHRLFDALEVVAELGYDGVALTLDNGHLDPFAPGLASATDTVAKKLESLSLAVVIETGARYVLDPRLKHEPTLVSETGRERRIDLLLRAIRVGLDLNAPAVSFWSGTLPVGSSEAEGWDRVIRGTEAVLDEAERLGMTLAMEPEPGMFLDTIDRVLELRARLGDPERLRLTVDVGHLRCNESMSEPECIRGAGPLIANVQMDDMRRGVHEHLELGTGEVDIPAVLAALKEADFTGLVAVELARHSHAAPLVAARSIAYLRAAESRITTIDQPLSSRIGAISHERLSR